MTTIMLVKVETNANSNKFYELKLDGDRVYARWGRVGATGQHKEYSGGQAQFDRLVRQKQSKGYREVEVVGTSSAVLHEASVKGLAKPEFENDSRITDVISRIVKVNAHSIATVSGGKIELAEGQLRTPLGVVGRASLDEAEKLLGQIADATDRSTKVELLEHYLTLVPQKVGGRRGWEDALLTPEALSAQSDFVQQLRDSLKFARVQESPSVDFRFSMGVVEPDDERFAQVATSFQRTINQHHSARRYQVSAVYEVTDSDEHMEAYRKALAAKGNEQWMWHGTRASNVLSILATGLYVPPASARFTTGRMFGNGVYMSKQSTKSAMYSGGAWAGQRLAQRAFMFSLQAVMGKSYRPASYSENFNAIRATHDSIDVPAGTAGVRNHEAVVWNLDHINMRYLVEMELS